MHSLIDILFLLFLLVGIGSLIAAYWVWASVTAAGT
jgi:hypothetical protein